MVKHFYQRERNESFPCANNKQNIAILSSVLAQRIVSKVYRFKYCYLKEECIRML